MNPVTPFRPDALQLAIAAALALACSVNLMALWTLL
jgi:hypothetical protein